MMITTDNQITSTVSDATEVTESFTYITLCTDPKHRNIRTYTILLILLGFAVSVTAIITALKIAEPPSSIKGDFINYSQIY